MPMRGLLAAGGGVTSALLFLAVIKGQAGGVLLAYLAPLPLFLTGLALGAGAAAGAAAVATLLAAAMVNPKAGFVYGLVVAAPAVLVVAQALRWRPDDQGQPVWYPAGRILAWIGAAGVAGLALGMMLAADPVSELEAQVRRFVEMGVGLMAPDLPEPMRAELVAMQTPLFPAGAAVGAMLMLIANGLAAQGLLERTGRHRRGRLDLAGLVLPWGSLAALAMFAAAALLLGEGWRYAARNLAVVAAVPFFFQGLGVVHTLARRLANPKLVLAGFYVALVPFFALAALAVTALGVVECWAGLRQRVGGPAVKEDG
ncbi:MAG: DUF2232 domain-containing protein [Rhodospirillales bacterium]|nr:DUF2232 domain-containing protein [Rhodospirillales bacterium]